VSAVMIGANLTQFGPEPRQTSSRRLQSSREGKFNRADHASFSMQERMARTKSQEELDSIVIGTLTAVDGSLRLHENLAFAVLSANDQPNYTPLPEEARILAPRACRKRQVEFALGRVAARLALQEVGFENPSPVLRGEGGEPLWPEGTAGSITHCYPWSIAVIAKCSNRFSIGIDLESLQRANGVDTAHLVCCDPELEWVCAGGDYLERLVMIFSAKEAVYKTFYPLCRRYIDFKEVQLSWLPAQSCFQGELLGAFGRSFSAGLPCVIHCQRSNDVVFSCLVHEVM
jgi:enterobactin synthetase component D / holo-[acyl-carrier protein] synthase